MKSWYLPDEHVADSSALIDGFVHGASRNGVRFSLNTRVLDLIVEKGRVCGVRTEDGPRYADKVLIAAGAWSERLVDGHSVRRPLIPLERSMFITSKQDENIAGQPWCWVDDAGIYFRPYGESWMCSPCGEKPIVLPDGAGSAGSTTKRHEDVLRAKIARYFPVMTGVEFERSWMGLRTFAPDRRPILGEDPELCGLWWAAGIGGYGISCSYAVGEVLAAWMQGQVTPWFGSELVSPNRPHFARWWILPEGDVLGARPLETI
jgi:glycine/D-amino acid oxidase-like deaminating enzyme